MPIFQLSDNLEFPPAHLASKDGLLAVGGDTSPKRLLAAYESGIFPWPHEGFPLLWFSPDPRFVVRPSQVYISKTMRKFANKTSLSIVTDKDFRATINHCAKIGRKDQPRTWINDEMIKGYVGLHEMGYAHSVEAYDQDRLVGGLYGVSLGGIFFGESMFSLVSNASKLCFATLAGNLLHWNFDLIDCQSHTQLFERLGAAHWPRAKFLTLLQKSLKKKTRKGVWTLELSPEESFEQIGLAQYEKQG